MNWYQKEFSLESRRRGFHVVTHEIENHLPELKNIKKGILHIFIKHTSASLTINENVSPNVCSDMETFQRNDSRKYAILRSQFRRLR
jgi:secondary thiamine-phosphate synthase enzyme